MPVPKRKLSRSRRDMRSANKFLDLILFKICSTKDCNNPILPHIVCDKCGFYKGRKVLEIRIKKAKEKSIVN